jgi:hypothetical protein
MRAGGQTTRIGREDSGGILDPLLVPLIEALARAAAKRDHAKSVSAEPMKQEEVSGGRVQLE